MKHSINYRVYYEDTDALGIMYHTNYIKFCERGRSELLRDIGLPASQLTEEIGLKFVIRKLEAHYLKMVHLDDELSVHTSVKSMKNTSFVMLQSIECQNSVVFEADITVVCVGADHKPMRIPDILRKKFEDYLL